MCRRGSEKGVSQQEKEKEAIGIGQEWNCAIQ
jgi:hypothetical protein